MTMSEGWELQPRGRWVHNGKAIAQHKGQVTQVTECQHGACQVTHYEEEKAPHSGGPGKRKEESKQAAGSMTSSMAGSSLFPGCAACHHAEGWARTERFKKTSPEDKLQVTWLIPKDTE